MDKSYLQVNNLHYSISGQTILHDISFSLAQGDILVIIGPNGSGKTTLLKLILGVIKPDKGTVLINNKNVKMALGKIAYVPQKFEFDRNIPITVKEFIALEKCGKKEHGARFINNALAQVGMADKEDKKLGVLSGGEFQRLMIARALLHEKELLIFDEPAAGIDLQGEATIYSLISQINQEKGTTCLIVSHELSVVSRFAKQVLCLNKSVVCFGPPQSAITPEVLQNLYGTEAGLYNHHE
ncbi:MAG: zinc transport system ATP-binding protein [Patescibacteria group bacterium]|nr:zinc transport system ATP-binding protein [Patescibacteria group bacterium]